MDPESAQSHTRTSVNGGPMSGFTSKATRSEPTYMSHECQERTQFRYTVGHTRGENARAPSLAGQYGVASMTLTGEVVGTTRVIVNPAVANSARNSAWVRSRPPGVFTSISRSRRYASAACPCSAF
jgi:hypothetical protein